MSRIRTRGQAHMCRLEALERLAACAADDARAELAEAELIFRTGGDERRLDRAYEHAVESIRLTTREIMYRARIVAEEHRG